ALAAAAVLALVGALAGRRPLWLDEAASATLADLPGASFRHVLLDREGNGLLHTVLLRGWQHVAPGDLGLRLPSLLATVIACVLLGLLADRLLSRRAALVAPVLLAANPVAVRYAVEARSYALLLALAVAAGLLLDRAVRRPSAGAFAAYAAVAGVAVYAHYFAVFMTAAHVLALLLVPQPGLRLRHLVPGAVLYLGLVSGLPRLMTDDAASGVGYLAGSPFAKALLVGAPVVGAVLLAALAVLVLHRRRQGRPLPLRAAPEQWPAVLLACWLLVPVGLAVAVSALRQPVLAPRYLVVCVPPAVLVLAAALDRLPWRRALAPLTAAAVVLGVLAGLAYVRTQDEDWPGAVRAVQASASPQDRVLFVAPYVRLPFARYADPAPAAAPAFPALPWDADPAPLFFYVPLPEDDVAAAVRDVPVVHLVVSHVGLYGSGDPVYAAVRAALERSHSVTGEEVLRGVVVQRWERTASR
ncbi:MAG: glycosyl transferase, family 39, partial [Frankiales bacterium]|nr:glycosyl transferase, family 39 [Frankiales bacterium]